jgi:hypothetical protein
MSVFLFSTKNGKITIKAKQIYNFVNYIEPLYNPLLAYNFNLEDLNNNPSSSYYNLLFNYSIMQKMDMMVV